MLSAIYSSPDNQPDTSALIQNEELVYDVSWAHIKIANLHLRIVSHIDNTHSRIVQATIESGTDTHLIDVHMIAYSEIDSSGNSIRSYSYEEKDDQWETMLYEYQPQNFRIIASSGVQDDTVQHPKHSHTPDTIKVSQFPVQDGISLIYFLRAFVRSTGALTMPTASMGKVGVTDIYPGREKTSIEINSCKQSIRVVKLSGKLRLEGISGLKGDFTGWFSDDEASVPIAAKMKVLIGNIRIELTQWNRSKWQPPLVK